MTHFFSVKSLEDVLALAPDFPKVGIEEVRVDQAFSRVLAADITAEDDMPSFRRSTMDGYAVHSRSTFGSSEANPAWLTIVGSVAMGDVPGFCLASGQAARIATGGMLPQGADSVVMVEHTAPVDDDTIEVYKPVAPLQHVIDRGEDFSRGKTVLTAGTRIRPQEAGLAASFGLMSLPVFRQPRVAIISTGDEIVPVDETPGPGKIRDINSYTLAGLIRECGGIPQPFGIVSDDYDALLATCKKAVETTDMVLISGGSSVGTRDFTVDVLTAIQDTEILVHGISISPGKPTILATSQGRPVWGLPGHVVSAMVVFKIVVIPFLNRIQGLSPDAGKRLRIPATLSRNVASAQGRRDFVRVRLTQGNGGLSAEPVLGKSGLIRTMVMADGLMEIGENCEGLEKGARVGIIPA